MADIAMCANPDRCPVKNQCYRNTAPVTPVRQSWAYFEPDKGEYCRGYYDR